MASINMFDPFSVSSASPDPVETGPKMSWGDIQLAVRRSHRVASALLGRMPNSFTFQTVDTPAGQRHRLYFLGVQSGQRDNTLLYVDVDDHDNNIVQAEIIPLLESFQPMLISYGQLSKDEQLLRERKRLRSFGIISYDYHELSRRFVFSASNRLFTCDEIVTEDGFSKEPIFATELLTSCIGSKLEPKICPSNAHLLAFISANDIWVIQTVSNKDKRMTFAHKGAKSLVDDPKSAGVPSFVVQEEFDRFTGYWWQPGTHWNQSNSQQVYRILYEEVDESDVNVLKIISPQSDGTAVDEYRYPRAGTNNAKSTLRLLEFEIDKNGAISNLCDVHLPEALSNLFPWMEYLLRAGWTPDGKYAYAVISDRCQQRLQIVLFSPACFCVPSNSVNGDDPMSINYMSNLTNNMYIVYEDNTDIWLHVHDVLYFFPQESSQQISFIYASEKSGHLHLYQIDSSLEDTTHNLTSSDNKSRKPALSCFNPMRWIDYYTTVGCPVDFGAVKPKFEERQLTEGDWEIDGKQIWVDEEKQLVYFVGFKDTLLESHLYVLSINAPHTVTRLTTLGYSHTITMDKSCSMFVSVYSSLQEAPSCAVFRLSLSDSQLSDSQLFLTTQVRTLLETSVPEYTPPECFSYESKSGFTMYGLVYKPEDMSPDKKYPTVVFVYAGPQVQMVSNTYKGMRFLRLHTLASFGYVVVVLDPRGSCHRGIKFEGHIRHRLGHTEVDDQVEGLQWLAETGGYIDLSRVAIHGWSYGGYISLLGLCQRPDVFKIAIAGAPVTSWELYDTGYTERYMGLPSQNQDGYSSSSVLKQVDKFPSDENRLLIIHGLIDENVHFYHTSALITALVKACKPYHLQVYPNERHGIRNPGTNEHYEAMLLSYLQQHL